MLTTDLLGLAASVEGERAVGLLSEGWCFAIILQCMHKMCEQRKGLREGLNASVPSKRRCSFGHRSR